MPRGVERTYAVVDTTLNLGSCKNRQPGFNTTVNSRLAALNKSSGYIYMRYASGLNGMC